MSSNWTNRKFITFNQHYFRVIFIPFLAKNSVTPILFFINNFLSIGQLITPIPFYLRLIYVLIKDLITNLEADKLETLKQFLNLRLMFIIFKNLDFS